MPETRVAGLHVRASGLVENTCEHGIGHPNKELTAPKFFDGIHGCDGCCGHEDFKPTGAQIASFKKAHPNYPKGFKPFYF